MLNVNDKVRISSKSETSMGDAKNASWILERYPNAKGFVTEIGSDYVKVAKTEGGLGNYFAFCDLDKVDTMKEKVSNLWNRFMDADLKILVERGYLSTSLEMTEKARQALEEAAFIEGKAKLVELAKAEKAAEDVK